MVKFKKKKRENIDKYLDLVTEQKKKKTAENEGDGGTNFSWCAWNGPQKGSKQLEIRGRIETIHTTALLRSVRILRRVLETGGDLLSL